MQLHWIEASTFWKTLRDHAYDPLNPAYVNSSLGFETALFCLLPHTYTYLYSQGFPLTPHLPTLCITFSSTYET